MKKEIKKLLKSILLTIIVLEAAFILATIIYLIKEILPIGLIFILGAEIGWLCYKFYKGEDENENN